MAEPFLARVPTLPEAELRAVLERPLGYQTAVVEAAAAELARRGQPLDQAAWERIRRELAQRDAGANLGRDFVARLGGSLPERLRRLRLITGLLLAAGLGAAAALYLTAEAEAANPLGYDPQDTKKYMREIELYGGKANVLAIELQRWFAGLWRGRALALTVAALTLLLAGLFWWIGAGEARDLEAEQQPGPGTRPGAG